MAEFVPRSRYWHGLLDGEVLHMKVNESLEGLGVAGMTLTRGGISGANGIGTDESGIKGNQIRSSHPVVVSAYQCSDRLLVIIVHTGGLQFQQEEGCSCTYSGQV